MSEQPVDMGALRAEYDRMRTRYKKLEASVKRDLKTCLDEGGIRVLSMESRIKKFDSLLDKLQRKGYDTPPEDISDMCGLRIICYYPSDVERVSRVIEEKFDVIESEDKAALLEPTEFGYLSLHFIVSPKEHWLRAPSYDGLDGLKAEIQVRTVFQHAWAELSRELAYKKREHVPRRFRRSLGVLAATLEDLDDRFDALHRRKAEYSEGLSEEARDSGRFDIKQELNVDTLHAFLEFHFAELPPSKPFSESELVGDLSGRGVTFQRLEAALQKVGGSGRLGQLMSDFSSRSIVLDPTRVHAVYTLLDLADDDWWEPRRIEGGWRPYVSFVQEYREKQAR